MEISAWEIDNKSFQSIIGPEICETSGVGGVSSAGHPPQHDTMSAQFAQVVYRGPIASAKTYLSLAFWWSGGREGGG